MKNWFPVNCKTHFSLLKGFCKPDKLVAKCADYGYQACTIADIQTISGAVSFHKACRKHNIKPLIGCDFGGYVLIAKNKNGWFDLIKLVTLINTEPNIDTLKDIAKQGNLICLSGQDSYKSIFNNNFFHYEHSEDGVYYVAPDEAIPHRVLLCSGMKTTLPKVQKKMNKGEHLDNERFFLSDKFYLPSPEDIESSEEHVDMLSAICDMCDDYEITEKPILPEFKCPDGLNEDEYLRELCRHGWKKLLISQDKISQPKQKQAYLDRIQSELRVISGANLAGYFLIVQDIINYVKAQGWLAGPGRGSAAGCLISYLLGVTEVDPIEYGLLFERFYNSGRNTGDHISLPDIDMDVPSEHRDAVIDYIKQKYNHDNVAQMITFGRLQGRAALKEVLRINETVSFSEMNEITENIPNEADISDQLELLEDKSIIRWSLVNQSKELHKWCKINDDGILEGPLANIFNQAITIEGTNKSQGKHAAGVIISQRKLYDVCPMVKDKNGNLIVAFEMDDLESQGHVKFDVLGIDLLSKIMDIQSS